MMLFKSARSSVFNNQFGAIPLIMLVAIIGVIAFLVIASVFPFRDQLLSSLYQKPSSFAAGSLTLTATFHSIGIEVSGEPAASGTLEFRKAGTTTWRKGLDLWQAGGALYGSALLLEAGTTYEVKVTPQGGTAITQSITTRADTIPTIDSVWNSAAETLKFYVRVNGDDAKDGKTEATAWKTLQKAFTSAPAGAVVQVGPGHFVNPTGTRTTPITVLAQYPAVDDNNAIINVGNQTIIEPSMGAGPATAAEPGVTKAPWNPVTLTGTGLAGAPAGATYTVWKWANSPITLAQQLGYASSHNALPKRIAFWKKGGADLSTPAGWVEKLYTNKSYNYGFYSDGKDIYLRMPGDANPNNFYFFPGVGPGITVNAANTRFSGIYIRQFEDGLSFLENAHNAVVDHSLFAGNQGGVKFTGTQAAPSKYAKAGVIEKNLFMDSNLWSTDPANPAIPWDFIKNNITSANGVVYPTNRLGQYSETSGVRGRGFANQLVVRNNKFDGVFDGLNGYDVDYDKYSAMDTDVYNNFFTHLSDDVSDISYNVINLRIWNNRIEHVKTVLSTGPISYGPVYFFRNQAFQVGNIGLGQLNGVAAGATVMFKYSGSSSPTARIYVLNNTLWTNYANTSGGDKYAGGGSNYEAYYLRNNVFRTTLKAYRAFNTANSWNEDYNFFTTSAGSRGIEYGPTYTTMAPYRTAYQTATGLTNNNTNSLGDLHDTSVIDNAFTNTTTGDFGLKAGSVLIDKGVVLANVADCFGGNAPDLGAIESGSATNCAPPPSTPPAATSSPVPSATSPAATASPLPSATPSQAPSKPGDVDKNNKVDIYDYNLLLTNFGKSGANIQADLNNSGKVDIFDYNLLLTNFGK